MGKERKNKRRINPPIVPLNKKKEQRKELPMLNSKVECALRDMTNALFSAYDVIAQVIENSDGHVFYFSKDFSDDACAKPDKSKDILSHQHFNGMFLDKNMFDYWHEFFDESTLNDQEIWLLWDYMKSIYTLKETAELFGRGYSHVTERSKCEAVKDTELCKRINEQMLPALFERVKQLLTNNE